MSDRALFIGSGDEITADDVPAPWLDRLHDIEPASQRNQQRALFAGLGIRVFAERVGDTGESLETAVSDFLGDLMHLCDATHMDFEHLVFMAAVHYEAEIGGEG